MQHNIKDDMAVVQALVFDAYKTSGQVMALLDNQVHTPAAYVTALERMSAQFEDSVIAVRTLCERHLPELPPSGHKPATPHLNLAGQAEVNHYGWLHIELNTLLPHCKYQTPKYLTDTITRLLDDYESSGRTLPSFFNAALIIDEHCDLDSRHVFDQDNKGWKAIPNALKGRVIPDDDQFTLGVCLLSTLDDNPACHIYLVPQAELSDFFAMRQGDYPLFP